MQVGADDPRENACDEHGVEATSFTLAEVKQLVVLLIILFGVDDLLLDRQSQGQLSRSAEVVGISRHQ